MLRLKFIFLLIYLYSTLGWTYNYPADHTNVYAFPATGDSVDQFVTTQKIINFLNQTYKAQIQSEYDINFGWHFEWDKNYLAAGSNIYNGEGYIMLWGGFVRAPGASPSLIALTLCHEIGHFLGGSPKQHFNGDVQEHWSSSEGQADWFAAKECLPLVYHELKNLFTAGDPSSYQATKLCQKTINPDQCKWILSTGQEFLDFSFYYFSDSKSQKTSLLNTAPEKPEQTLINTYPSDQCRLDTYKAGGLCASQAAEKCQRPACWFVP